MTLHTAVIDAGSSGTRLFLYRVERAATYVHMLLARLFAGTGRRLVRAVPSRRNGDTMLTWTRGYLLSRHSQGTIAGGGT